MSLDGKTMEQAAALDDSLIAQAKAAGRYKPWTPEEAKAAGCPCDTCVCGRTPDNAGKVIELDVAELHPEYVLAM